MVPPANDKEGSISFCLFFFRAQVPFFLSRELERETSRLRSSITIQHCFTFNHLFPSFLVTPLTFKQIVSLTRSINETEQFFHVFSSEMSTDISFFINDTRRKVLFVRLSLENYLVIRLGKKVSLFFTFVFSGESKERSCFSLFSSTVPVATKR